MRGALATAVLGLVIVTGCSAAEKPTTVEAPAASAGTPGETSQGPVETPTASGSSSVPVTSGDDTIEIEIEGDRIEPGGRRVEVSAGEAIVLDIESDRPAELHVHSSPEQVVEVDTGHSTVRLTIETPGVVDVEEHHSGLVVLQLEVR